MLVEVHVYRQRFYRYVQDAVAAIEEAAMVIVTPQEQVMNNQVPKYVTQARASSFSAYRKQNSGTFRRSRDWAMWNAPATKKKRTSRTRNCNGFGCLWRTRCRQSTKSLSGPLLACSAIETNDVS
jgi:hypothetical protein